ncbi:DUF4318 domain-containing protein [Robinsoniella peoriensis]|uniref:DUF4318 domain-containing protein n=1 Tax=Robinsoniella peoriensis TaxID=180332 RepID=UPI00085CA195|nr:DUF4318 domain-containing protein [Robinsoniella peoriensis]
MSVDNLKECGLKGSFLGLVLMMSSLLVVSLTGDAAGMTMVLPYIPAIMAVYLLLGILCWLLHGRSPKEHSWLLGAAVYYWMFLIMIIVMTIAAFLTQTVRYVILVNIAVLFVLWLMEYVSLKKIADELNQGMPQGRSALVVDLDEKPATMEAYFHEIEKYCEANHWNLEYIKKEKPALIRINGKKYAVKMGLYYTPIGTIVYTMTFSSAGEQD